MIKYKRKLIMQKKILLRQIKLKSKLNSKQMMQNRLNKSSKIVHGAKSYKKLNKNNNNKNLKLKFLQFKKRL